MSAYFFFLPKPAALLNQSPGKANSGKSVRANLQKNLTHSIFMLFLYLYSNSNVTQSKENVLYHSFPSLESGGNSLWYIVLAGSL